MLSVFVFTSPVVVKLLSLKFIILLIEFFIVPDSILISPISAKDVAKLLVVTLPVVVKLLLPKLIPSPKLTIWLSEIVILPKLEPDAASIIAQLIILL